MDVIKKTYFIVTKQDEIVYKNILSNRSYKYLDIAQIKSDYIYNNPGLTEEYKDILVSQHIIKKIKNSMKSFKNDFFIYRTDKLSEQLLKNLKTIVDNIYSHKIKNYIIFEDDIEGLISEDYIIDMDFILLPTYESLI